MMNSKNNNSQLHTYLSATILINLFCLFINGHSGDLGFWENWTHQLADNGYYLFNGNYPPLYIHWLYLISKGLHCFELPIETNDLCKFLWELPVLLTHCLLTWIVFNNLRKFNASANQALSIMLITIFNPAILIDGPIWGQVDLIPPVLAISAISINFSKRYSVLMLPIFTLALLTKFQVVCFLPIVGILFFHRFKTHILGISLSLLTILVVFSPFIYVHYYKEAFQHAYIDTLGQYPVITMNAANLWVLLVGNNAPDNVQFLSQISHLLPQKLIYPKYLGMFLYSAVCLCIFIFGINNLIKTKKNHNTDEFVANIFFYAMVSAIAFFTLLPAMHERYLFPAVVCATVYSSITKNHIAYAIMLSIASALNMIIILSINGSDIWSGLSALVTLIFAISLLQLFAGNAAYNVIFAVSKSFFRIPFSSFIVFIIAISTTLTYLIDRHSVHKAVVGNNQTLLTALPLISARQDYGTIQFNRSVDGKPLAVGNKRFADGIGTHANSSIVFTLPNNAIGFDVIPGIDDEVGAADVIFEVYEDNNPLWSSAPYYGFEKPIKVHINLHKGKELKLVVNSNGERSWDHADWINPILTLENTPQ
jgi:hypothetical protein